MVCCYKNITDVRREGGDEACDPSTSSIMAGLVSPASASYGWTSGSTTVTPLFSSPSKTIPGQAGNNRWYDKAHHARRRATRRGQRRREQQHPPLLLPSKAPRLLETLELLQLVLTHSAPPPR